MRLLSSERFDQETGTGFHLLDLALPPRFQDRDDDRVAATLHGAALIVVAISVPALFLEPPDGLTFGLESPLVGIGSALAALFLARRGHLRAGSALFVLGFTAGVSAAFVRSGTFYTPGVGALVLTVVLSGLLIGTRAALVAATGVVGLLLGLEALFASAAWRGRPSWNPAGASVLWWLPTFLTAGTVTALASARIRGALGEADRSEKELARRHHALAESESRYRALVQNSPLGVMTLSRELSILSVNAELVELTGAPAADALVGRRLTEFPVFAVAEVARARSRVLDGLRTEFESSWTSAWGRALQVRVHLAPIHGEDGAVTGAQALVEDVSDQKRLEAQLVQSHKLEATGRLAGSVAHDFNNYLTAILGSAELLAFEHGDDPKLREPLEEIVQAAERSAKITRQLLAFGRRQVIQPRVLSPNRLIEDLVPVLERVTGPGVELETALDPELGCVRADPSQLEVVLVNLATNARDAMPDGGQLTIETLRVEVSEQESAVVSVAPGACVQIRVTDTGLGMDPSTRARIFEPFFTTKEEGRGSGLGLATAHGVVTQSGGALTVESEPGRGSSFRFLLPLLEAEEPRANAGRPRAMPRGSETILLVEDERGVRATARAMLESHGYEVVEAEHGESGLVQAIAHGDRIDLLVTDVVMPGMGGLELADRVRARLPQLPVLFISGYSEELKGGDVDGTGAVLLQKPFTTRDLLVHVRERLESRQAASP